MQRRSRPSAVGVAALFACLLAATSCDTALSPDANGVDSIVLTPSSASVQAGATLTLTPLVLDAAGNAMRERKVVWATENATIATVSQSGVVTGVTAGVAQVAASSGGKSASAAITVTPRPVSLVRVTPGSATISVTGSMTLQAEALDASGAPVLGRPVIWTSSNETIALVSGSGVVAGIAAGSVTITATIDGRAGTAAITVAPQPVASVSVTPSADTIIVGRRVTFRATPLDAQSLPLAGRTIVWTSNNPAAATVSSTGEVLGLAVGTANIRATVEGKFAEATILVQPVPVSRVVIAPNLITLNPGQTSQLTVTLNDSAGNVLSGRSIVYTTSDAQIATVSATGLITAIAEGSAQVQASSEGKTATTVVTVNPVPVASIQVTPNAVSLGIAQSTRLAAQAFDAAGKPLTNRKFTWISGAPTVATVNQSGDVTAVAGGNAVIFAATEGISASATVSVTASVSSISVAPPSPTLSVGQTILMTAIVRDVNGIILTGRPVAWSSTNPAVAAVASSGVVTAVASGTATISANSEGKSGFTTVTVSVIPVARVDVAPTTVSLNPGQTSQLTATAYDAANNVLQRSVTWSSSNQAAATVSSAGLVTAVGAGPATISATAGGVSGSAVVTVANVPVANVTVTPSAPNMFPGDALTLTATARDAAGNVITGRPTTWVSSNTSVATVVAATGVVTAVATGAATITAIVDGVSGSATVTINATPVASVTLAPASAALYQGQQTGFIATARDAGGNVISRPITWSTTNPTIIINVTQGGVVTAINPGTEGVIAMAVGAGAGGTNVGDTATVTVSLVPVASLSISPTTPVTIFIGQQQPLTVQLFDSVGGSLSAAGRTITWTSLNPSIATVNASGLVSAVAAGNTQVVVSTPGATGTVADTTNVTVSTSPIVSVAVQPKPNTIYQGATKSLRAVVLNASSTIPLRGRNVLWIARPAGIVTVSQVAGTPDSATYAVVALGTTYIVAEDPSGLRDSTFVSAQPVPVTSVVVTPSPATVDLTLTTQLNAVARDSVGNPLARTITWVSLAPSIASVDATGLVTANAAGTATIEARANGAGVNGANVVGTATMTVNVPVNTVTVTSTRTFIVPSDTMLLTVELRDAQNNVMTGPITYLSSAPGSASVNPQGVVTGGTSTGPVTITATSGGKSNSVTITAVTPVSQLSVAGPTPADTLIIANSPTIYTVTVTDAGGIPLVGRSLAVSTSPAGIATISATSATTNASGQAQVTVTGQAIGTVAITFSATRQGAIPPGSSGSNTATGSIVIRVQ